MRPDDVEASPKTILAPYDDGEGETDGPQKSMVLNTQRNACLQIALYSFCQRGSTGHGRLPRSEVSTWSR